MKLQTALQAPLALLSAFVVLAQARGPLLAIGFWLLLTAASSEYVWRSLRAGWLTLTLTQLHERIRVEGRPAVSWLELLTAVLAVIAGVMLTVRP